MSTKKAAPSAAMFPSYGGHHHQHRAPGVASGACLPAITGDFNVTRRHRPPSALKLTAMGLPSLPAHAPTLPRERGGGHPPVRLSSSDSRTIERFKDPSHNSSHTRRHTADGRLLVRDKSPPPPHQYQQRPIARERGSLSTAPQRPPSSSSYSQPVGQSRVLYRAALPPISPESDDTIPVDETTTVTTYSDSIASDVDSSDTEDEIYSDEGSEAPPSRPGFESEAERSGQSFSIPFPEVNKSSPFPATIIQDHAQLDQDKLAASAHPSGLSARVDNIVRAFSIHGPLNREMLSKALDKVASLHPLLSASFQRCSGKLYMQTSHKGNKLSVTLESPIIGHEKPPELIMNARRKLFPLTMKSDLVPDSSLSSSSTGGGGEREDQLNTAISLVSVLTDSPDGSPVLPSQKKKSVSFASNSQPKPEAGNPILPALHHVTQMTDSPQPTPLIRARLVSKSPHEHMLVLSFPTIICDYWSSCLFAYQLADAYGKQEKSAAYRPSLAAMRIDNKRQAVIHAHEKLKEQHTADYTHKRQMPSRDAASRLLQKRSQPATQMKEYTPPFPAKLHFQQVAKRENQLLLMQPRERLWAFWESMVTATIQRQRGPNRVKVVPPVRIPSGLGKKTPARGRPQTSRLRPLTAAKNRPQTAKRQGVFGEMGVSREALLGPPTHFHYVKVTEDVCSCFVRSLPESCLSSLKEEELLSLFCLGGYALMLGKCCRGWGADSSRSGGGGGGGGGGGWGEMVRGRGDGASRTLLLHNDSLRPHGMVPVIAEKSSKPQKTFVSDPLQKYKSLSSHGQRPTVLANTSPNQRGRRASITGRLDLGSFLLGIDVSLRELEPAMTQGLFGPLTNSVGVRINLSSSETFADLVMALARTLQLSRKHGHFPFSTIADEVGLVHGLPIKFSFLRCHDIAQLTNPSEFYFPETALGVEGHGLARFGSSCYLTPLSSKMDDNCHFELLLWEGAEGDCVSGVIRSQPHVIRSELVEAFGSELSRLLAVVAEDPCRPLLELAGEICPPFLSSSRTRYSKKAT